jgi:hypothetical protein
MAQRSEDTAIIRVIFTQWHTLCIIPEDLNLQQHRFQNLKSHYNSYMCAVYFWISYDVGLSGFRNIFAQLFC